MMKWASAISTEPRLEAALQQVIGEARTALDGAPAHLLVVFVSSAYDGGPDDSTLGLIPQRLRAAFPGARLIGCTGGGILGCGRELEGEAALTLLAAHLPDVAVGVHHLIAERLPDAEAPPEAWQRLVALDPAQQPAFLLLPDPFSIHPAPLLAALDRAFPGAPKLGGIASGGQQPGACALLMDERVVRYGAVLLSLVGDLQVDTVVAQGCRPVGVPMAVTRAEKGLILSLEGERVASTLRTLFDSLSPRDQALFRRAPMLGIAMNPERAVLRAGDFLVRDIQGIAQPAGALAVGAPVSTGQVVQLHVRDPAAAALELRDLLAHTRRKLAGDRPAAALMFTCLGRGARFFGSADHDSGVVQSVLGPVPLGGFFCNGELGPVHGETFLHGYTSVIGLLRPSGWS